MNSILAHIYETNFSKYLEVIDFNNFCNFTLYI